jgi:hypothetical protein
LIQASASRGVVRLGKGPWLHLDELSICGDLIRPLMIGPMWRPSVHLLSDLLLHLQDLARYHGLSGHEGLLWCPGRRWRQVTATSRSEPVGRAARGSHHLKCEPLLDT